MRRVFLLICALIWAPSIWAQGLVSDLSERKIDIRTQFSGADLILFGAIGRASALELDQDFDIVAIVRGPEQKLVVRRKDKIAGLWINKDSVLYQTAVGYYSLAATKPLAEIAGEDQLAVHQIGIENLLLSPTLSGDVAAGELSQFRAGLVRHLRREGLYPDEVADIEVFDDTLFRTRIRLPARVPVGSYSVDIFLFSKGRVVDHATQMLNVDKSGLERWIFSFAQEKPMFYGLAAVVIALFSGWLAGFVYRKG